MAHGDPTPTVEDYLGIIYTMERDGDIVIGARLAEWLEVKAPTVTATIKRMIRDGWVVMDERKEIHLTPAGRLAAASVLRRHMLSELLLARLLGVPWSRVHAEADQMEHTISHETMQRILEHFEDPQTCPHGNPLPGYEDLAEEWFPLTQARAQQTAIIRRVHESLEEKQDVMIFLENHHLMPGTQVDIIEVIPFNETISLCIDGRPVVLGFAIAQAIFIQVE